MFKKSTDFIKIGKMADGDEDNCGIRNAICIKRHEIMLLCWTNTL